MAAHYSRNASNNKNESNNRMANIVHCKKWIFQKNVNMTSKDNEITYLLFQETFQLSYQFWMVVDKFVFPDYS